MRAANTLVAEPAPQGATATHALDIRCYVPSFNDSDAVCQTVASCNGLPVVIVDNGSEPEHVAVLRDLEQREPGCTVVYHGHNRGRVENWAFCVQHFLDHSDVSGAGESWLKWVFAGDTLAPDAAIRLTIASQKYPDVSFIAADYELALPDRRCWRRQELPKTERIIPVDAMRIAARQGNWFGAPIGHCIRRDAIAAGFEFGPFPWSADFHFCLQLASHSPVLYLSEPVGRFELRHRRYHQANADSHQAVLQDAIVRLDAARRYRDLTGDREGFYALVEQIEAYVAAQTLARVADTDRSAASVREIARLLRLRDLFRLLIDETIFRLRGRARQHKID
jgi:hypothetical protein